MADNVTITEGSGTQIAADDVGGVKYQRIKVATGADGTANDVSSSNPLPTQIIQGDTSQAIEVQDQTVGLLKILVDLLYSNAITDAGQRQRIVVDVINGSATLATVTTVSGVTNVAGIFGVNQQMYMDMLHMQYDSGIRDRVTL